MTYPEFLAEVTRVAGKPTTPLWYDQRRNDTGLYGATVSFGGCDVWLYYDYVRETPIPWGMSGGPCSNGEQTWSPSLADLLVALDERLEFDIRSLSLNVLQLRCVQEEAAAARARCLGGVIDASV